jgi:outer membrane protein TolC
MDSQTHSRIAQDQNQNRNRDRDRDPHSRPRKQALSFTGIVLVLIFSSGCGPAHYRRSADKEVYRIVEQVEGQIFGRTNAFSIDTAYSARKPEEISPGELIEDRLKTNRHVLKVEDALDLAVKRSRTYQTQKETLYLTALTLTGQRYQFSPQFLAGTTASYQRDSLGERSASLDSQVGVSQLLRSGGNLGLNLVNDLLRYYTGDPRKSVLSTLSVNLVQPLLRGFGRDNASLENLRQAERNVIYAVRNFGYFQHQFAMQIVNDYYRLLAQRDVIRSRYTNYLGRVQLTKRLEARAKDREQLSGVDQARQSELTAKNNYVNALATYFNSLDQFKIQLGLSLGERVYLDDQALSTMMETGPVAADLDPEQAFRIAVTQQLQILNAIDEFEDSKRKIRVAANQLKSDLNFSANAALDSDPYPDYTKFDPSQIRWTVGLSLDLPVDRLRERNTYRATLVSFESQLRSLTLTLDNLMDSIQRGMRTLAQRRQNYEIQRIALDLANRRVTSTTMLLEAGRAEVRDLLEAQDSQISSQNALTAALVDYQETRLQLMLDIGALNTELPLFWLKDHIAAFLPTGQPAAARTPSGEEQTVPTPETFFERY